MTDFPDCGAGVAREARQEIELSPLATQLEAMRDAAGVLWNRAQARQAFHPHTPERFTAEELFAEVLLEATENLPRLIDVIVETKAQEERAQAW